MDKELTILAERLERIFPDLEMCNKGCFIDLEENEYIPPTEKNWYDIIEKLKKNGLEIKNIKYEKI